MSSTPATIQSLSHDLVVAISARIASDSTFRKHLLADPEKTLRAEGMDVFHDFIVRLKGADPAAIEASVHSGEKNSSC